MLEHTESRPHFHPHTHGAIEPAVLDTQCGIRAVNSSSFLLLVTGVLQVIVVLLSNSAALLADAIHNLADVATAVPLWIAFVLSRWKPTNRFTYGYGRVEDLAGLMVIMVITLSGVASGYVAINRLFHPQPIAYIGIVIAASLLGFLGNEGAAMIRIKAGKEIGSAALIADGNHARADGFTSLGVLLGAVGVWLGYPLADPLFGLLITLVIFLIAWESGAVISDLSIERGHEIAKEARHLLLHHLNYLSNATIHIDPLNASGEKHHGIANHVHDDLPAHSH